MNRNYTETGYVGFYLIFMPKRIESTLQWVWLLNIKHLYDEEISLNRLMFTNDMRVPTLQIIFFISIPHSTTIELFDVLT